jgi:hypothetical protein
MEERDIVKEEGGKCGVGMVMNFSPNFGVERERKREKERNILIFEICSYHI